MGSVGSHLRLHYTLSLYQFTVFRQVFSMINETSLDSILELIFVFYINIKIRYKKKSLFSVHDRTLGSRKFTWPWNDAHMFGYVLIHRLVGNMHREPC